MKLEKLTENKIRVILTLEDLENNNLTFDDFATNANTFQTFFVNMLDKAEKELGFITKDYKLLIESFSSSEDIFVFTITRFDKNRYKKSVTVRKKKTNFTNSNLVYSFENFDVFCYFCKSIQCLNNLKIAKDISLYFYHNTYYLLFTDIDKSNKQNKKVFYHISEFGNLVSKADGVTAKIKEHGKLIMKHNAIARSTKYF